MLRPISNTQIPNPLTRKNQFLFPLLRNPSHLKLPKMQRSQLMFVPSYLITRCSESLFLVLHWFVIELVHRHHHHGICWILSRFRWILLKINLRYLKPCPCSFLMIQALSRLSEMIRSHKEHEIVDFANHLDKPSLSWLPKVSTKGRMKDKNSKYENESATESEWI